MTGRRLIATSSASYPTKPFRQNELNAEIDATIGEVKTLHRVGRSLARVLTILLAQHCSQYFPRHFLDSPVAFLSEMTAWKQLGSTKPPVLLKVRSSEWFIGITVFVAAFNVGNMSSALPLLPPTSPPQIG